MANHFNTPPAAKGSWANVAFMTNSPDGASYLQGKSGHCRLWRGGLNQGLEHA